MWGAELVRAPFLHGMFICGSAGRQIERTRIGVDKQRDPVLILALQKCFLDRCTFRWIDTCRTTSAASRLSLDPSPTTVNLTQKDGD